MSEPDSRNDAEDRLPGEPGGPIPPGATILTVGRTITGLPGSVIATPFNRLTGSLLQRVKPEVVAFPLMGRDCDASQVVERLSALGFRGLALVLAPDLPDPAMVLRELQGLAPELFLRLQAGNP